MQALQAVVPGCHPLLAAAYTVRGRGLQGRAHAPADHHARLRARFAAVPGRQDAGKPQAQRNIETIRCLLQACIPQRRCLQATCTVLSFVD
jgi:hypothetical protein